MTFSLKSESKTEKFGPEVMVGGTRVVHPQKIWWPQEKITKLDVVRYYAEMAPFMLPFMEDHPLTAERCPDGIRGECFFQKNFADDLPQGVPRRAIRAESTGEMVHYVIGGSKDTLLALVNLGCLAVHVMNCRAEALDRPEWLAFDLDPASGEFSDAAQAGKILLKILEELKLHSFPKTSGGKGLHVLIPLRRGPDQDKVRDFALSVGREMARRAPKLVTVQLSKSKRRGRVFADWLRNAFGQTIVAPYSVRRRPGAPVSTPLDWEEVRPGLNPASFNIRTVRRRLKGKNPWSGFWLHRQTLPEALAAKKSV